MNLWRLEWLRLTRTRRVFALLGVYVFFGATAAPLARYLTDILQQFGGGVQVVMPPPTPVDGFANYVSSANQLGLLVYVLVISSTLAFDAQHEMAVFLRTRVPRLGRILLPKYVVNVAAGAGAFAIGMLATWYGTVLLLGSVDTLAVIEGTFAAVLYLAFVGALAAAFASRLHSVVTTAMATLAVAALLGLVGSFAAIGKWLPSHLLGGLTELPAGVSFSTYLASIATTIVAGAVLLWLSVRWGSAREL